LVFASAFDLRQRDLGGTFATGGGVGLGGASMSSFSEFFGRKGGAAATAAAEKSTAPAPVKSLVADDRSPESLAELGTRIGGDNEVLRNLLVDTGHRIGALDELKDAFTKLVDPISKTLRTLEQEKSENVSLRHTLADIRTNYEALRNEFNDLGKRNSANETEVERLRHELDISQHAHRTAEAGKTEHFDELTTVRGKVGELERNLSQELAAVRMLTDEKHSLLEHSTAGDKRIAELEGETAQARERLVLLENEKRSLQNSLDVLVGDNSRVTRRLNENENALAGARGRIEQLETALAAAEQDRTKLTSHVDEAHERRQAESNTLTMRLEAMQSRAVAAEKLLAEVRQSLIARTEENRVSERKVVEATIARNSTEKKLEQMLVSLQTQERQLRDLESSRSTLVERSSTLLKTVKTRETALTRAEEKIQTLTDRVTQLETEAEQNRAKTEKRTEELNSSLQRERLERAVTEGALEATRKNYAELQRELAAERGGRREETKPELVADTGEAAADASKSKAGKGKGKSGEGKVEPIITP
jgi:chromosome segregation ATPase